MKYSCRDGYVLVMVLIITGIGLLFGAGSLLLFRYQCQLRIDRQHELEKVYAVRSVLNWLRTYDEEMAVSGLDFAYYTWSGRNMGLIAKPVETRFPNANATNPMHFCIERGDFMIPSDVGSDDKLGFYDSNFDYECGAEGVTNLLMRNTTIQPIEGQDVRLLEVYDAGATNGVTWWVNIGMDDKGSWLKEHYGLRYQFHPWEYIGGGENTATEDCMQFCLVRDKYHDGSMPGRSRGWPLSQDEIALIFRIVPIPNSDDAEIQFFELKRTGNAVSETTRFRRSTNNGRRCPMGLQIAGRSVSLFYIDTRFTGAASTKGYTFCGTTSLTDDAYEYFKGGADMDFTGTFPNAPKVRAVFVVDASSNMRPSDTGKDAFTKFKVTPAWQYDVFIEYPASHIQLATIAQRTGVYNDDANAQNCTMLTYDTHGTENKGFRKDEREAERRRNGQ